MILIFCIYCNIIHVLVLLVMGERNFSVGMGPSPVVAGDFRYGDITVSCDPGCHHLRSIEILLFSMKFNISRKR